MDVLLAQTEEAGLSPASKDLYVRFAATAAFFATVPDEVYQEVYDLPKTRGIEGTQFTKKEALDFALGVVNRMKDLILADQLPTDEAVSYAIQLIGILRDDVGRLRNGLISLGKQDVLAMAEAASLDTRKKAYASLTGAVAEEVRVTVPSTFQPEVQLMAKPEPQVAPTVAPIEAPRVPTTPGYEVTPSQVPAVLPGIVPLRQAIPTARPYEPSGLDRIWEFVKSPLGIGVAAVAVIGVIWIAWPSRKES